MQVLLLAGLLVSASLQEPSEELQRALRLDSSATRYRAAERLAESGPEAEAWLLDEVGKGSPERQRALLLACALTGSEEALAAVEEAARRGSRRRGDPQRAYALLLYGARHPDAGLSPEDDWERCQTDYERACLLLGLMGQPQRLRAADWDALLEDDGSDELEILLEAGRMLAGGAAMLPDPCDPRLGAAHMLASVLPGADGRNPAALEALAEAVPALWSAAARRAPARDAEEVKRLPAAGGGAAAGLFLREIAEADRQEVFLHFDRRMVDADARAWLWGTAGDLGLDLPPPVADRELSPAEVAGILRLARVDAARAGAAAEARLDLARAALDAGGLPEELWPAALVLALSLADAEDRADADLARIRAQLDAAEPAWKVRLWPVWNLARGNLSEDAARARWLSAWSRELNAGYAGYLDREGPRWAAFLLVGGTQAAEERLPLREARPGLALEARDYSRDHNLYRDVADFLAWGYRFGLPD